MTTRLEATRAKINNKIFHSLLYSRKGKTNSYTICYNQNKYANILYFFIFEGKIFAFIENLEVETNIRSIFDSVEKRFIKYVNIKKFEKFYKIIRAWSYNQDIICVKDITCKSILVRTKEHIYVTNLITTCTTAKYSLKHA